jgi:(2Fe-2S) ferredoxin
LAPFVRHVFVCQNVRPEGAPRPSCTQDGKGELLPALQQFTKAADLGSTVRINKAGCLDQCEHGPTVVVYPDAVWYGEHLVGGRPVERLRLADDCVNTKSCPHRA